METLKELRAKYKQLKSESDNIYNQIKILERNVNEPYYCVCASWNYCIPYEGNEHLLGTTENVGK